MCLYKFVWTANGVLKPWIKYIHAPGETCVEPSPERPFSVMNNARLRQTFSAKYPKRAEPSLNLGESSGTGYCAVDGSGYPGPEYGGYLPTLTFKAPRSISVTSVSTTNVEANMDSKSSSLR